MLRIFAPENGWVRHLGGAVRAHRLAVTAAGVACALVVAASTVAVLSAAAPPTGNTLGPSGPAFGGATAAAMPVSRTTGSTGTYGLTPKIAAAESAAVSAAIATRKPVVVAAEETATSEVAALPDGHLQLTSSSVPVRVRRGNTWVPVDLSLERGPGGWISPKAAPVPVQFSGGGTRVLDRVPTASGAQVTESWAAGTLPKPQLTGATATYRDVLPGVDVELTATLAGMDEVVVVRSAHAATNPKLAALRLAVQGAKLASTGGGAFTATAPDASTLLSGSAQWWDSSSAGASANGPGAGHARAAARTVSASATTMNVAAIAATRGLVYPVFVDPAYSASLLNDWYDDTGWPTNSYLNGANSTTWLATGTGQGGTCDNISPCTGRAFWQFGVSGIDGRHVMQSTLALTETGQFAGSSQVQLYNTGNQVPPGTNQVNEYALGSGVWSSPVGSPQSTAPSNTSSFAVSMDTTSTMQSVSDANQSTLEFGLRSTDEANVLTRTHWALTATLVSIYDTIPNTPANLVLTSPVRNCGTAAAPVYVNSAAQALTLQASITSSDTGQNLYGIYTVSPVSSPSVVTARVQSAQQGPGVFGNQSAQIPQGGLPDGAYQWNVVATDGQVSSSVSANCYFDVENEAPKAPTVSTPGMSGQNVYGDHVGDKAVITISSGPTDGVVEYVYWWVLGAAQSPAPPAPVQAAKGFENGAPCTGPYLNNGNQTNIVNNNWTVCAAPGGAATQINAAPPATDATLWVAGLDAAGNVSVSPSGDNIETGIDFYSSEDTTLASTLTNQWRTDNAANGTMVHATNSYTGNQVGGGVFTPGGGYPVAAAPASKPVPGTNDPTGNALSLPGTKPVNVPSVQIAALSNSGGAFTIGAWLDPADTSTNRTALAISDGTNATYPITLNLTNGHWQICAATTCATSNQTAVTNQWAFVWGTWNQYNQRLELHVGDDQAAEASVALPTVPVTTTNALLSIGAGNPSYSNPVLPFDGLILDPYALGFTSTSVQNVDLFSQAPLQ